MTGRIRCRNLILAYNPSLGRATDSLLDGELEENGGDTYQGKMAAMLMKRQSNESLMGYEPAKVERRKKSRRPSLSKLLTKRRR